jgi:hypothetical protein
MLSGLKGEAMKRIVLVAALSVLVVLVANCDLFGGGTPDYYPQTIGSNWLFESALTFEQADADTVYTSRTHSVVTRTANLTAGDEVAEFVSTDSTHMRFPAETTQVSIDTVYVRQTDSYVLAYESLDDQEPDTALAIPLEENKTWTFSSRGDTVITGTVVAKETVTTPAGDYQDCWKVEMMTTVGTETVTMYWWYADGIGRVRNWFEETQQGIKTTLEAWLADYEVK